MAYYVKKDGVWQLAAADLTYPAPPIEPLPALLLPRPLSPEADSYAQIRNLPPGNHAIPGAMVFVPPPGKALRVLQFQRKGKGSQAVFCSDGKPLVRPLKQARTLGRKERRTEITMDLGSPLPIDAIITPLDGSQLRITSRGQLLRPVKTVGENYYNRAKKRKVLNRFVQTDQLPHWNVDSLLRQFPSIYAIDTNTSSHSSGKRLSVSSVIQAALRPVDETHSIMDGSHYWTFFRFDVEGNPENSAWVLLLERLLLSAGERLTGDVLIIVDSELPLLEDYCLRRLPLYRDLYLPESFHLLYAYDSLGGDQFFVNRLMSLAHTSSRFALRNLQARPLAEILANARESTVAPGE